ncbi:hypothetical protein ACVBEH_23030 [Roseateles sp. GG27B]
MMKAKCFVLSPDQREPALNVLGTQVTVLASNAATQSYGITFQQGDEGTGPPPHSHDWAGRLHEAQPKNLLENPA